MEFKDFKKIFALPNEITAQELADKMEISKRMAYLYIENGIPMDTVEKYANKLGIKLNVTIATFDTDIMTKFKDWMELVIFNRIANEIKIGMPPMGIENIAGMCNIPEPVVQSVLDGNCRDWNTILLVGTCCGVKFHYKGGFMDVEKNYFNGYDNRYRDKHSMAEHNLLPEEPKLIFINDNWVEYNPAIHGQDYIPF